MNDHLVETIIVSVDLLDRYMSGICLQVRHLAGKEVTEQKVASDLKGHSDISRRWWSAK